MKMNPFPTSTQGRGSDSVDIANEPPHSSTHSTMGVAGVGLICIVHSLPWVKVGEGLICCICEGLICCIYEGLICCREGGGLIYIIQCVSPLLGCR